MAEEQRADDIRFFNRASGLKATNVQAAIEEVAAGNEKIDLLRRIKDVGSGRIMTDSERAKLTEIERRATADQTAAEVPYSGDVMADTVQEAINVLSVRARRLESRSHQHQNAAALERISDSGSGNVITKEERENLHAHDNMGVIEEILGVGSGSIITAKERNKLEGIETNATQDQSARDVPISVPGVAAANVEDAIVFLRGALDEAMNHESHIHTNSGVLEKIGSAGSGSVITSEERDKLHGIEPGATKDQAASDVPYSPERSRLKAADVQKAIDVLADMRQKDRFLAHGHDNLDTLKEITPEHLITENERVKLATVEFNASHQEAEDVPYDPYRIARSRPTSVTPYNVQEALDYWGHDHLNINELVCINDAGSGRIITDDERQAIIDLGDEIITVNQNFGNLVEETDLMVSAATSQAHSHPNADVLARFTDAGSGKVITDAERRKLLEVEPHAKDDQVAREVPYNGHVAGLDAADVQAAIDQLALLGESLGAQSHTHKNMDRLNAIHTTGSGSIMTVEERAKLKSVKANAAPDQEAGQVPTRDGGNVQSSLDDLEAKFKSVNVLNHQHDNQDLLNRIESAGSGRIIGHAERAKLMSMHMPEASEVDFNGENVTAPNVEVAIDKVAAATSLLVGDSHKHSALDILEAIQSPGSGRIITSDERDKLKTVQHGARAQDAKAVPYDSSVSRLSAKDVQRAIDELVQTSSHTHDNLKALTGIRSSGSGDVMTVEERRKLATIEAGANRITDSTQIMHDEHNVGDCINGLQRNIDAIDNHGHKNAKELTRIQSAGSGFVISNQEREKLASIEPNAAAARDATQIPCGPNASVKDVFDKHSVHLAALRRFKHLHKNAKILDGIIGLGSASIITDEEREKLAGIETGATVTKDAGQIIYKGNATVHQAIAQLHEDVSKTCERNHLHPNAVALAKIIKSGSGEIITSAERSKLAGIEPGAMRVQNGEDVPVQLPDFKATNVHEALLELLAKLHDLETKSHQHAQLDMLEAITDAGSGVVMTEKERDKLDEIEYNATDDQDGTEVVYDNAVSGLKATTVQGAIDELAQRK